MLADTLNTQSDSILIAPSGSNLADSVQLQAVKSRKADMPVTVKEIQIVPQKAQKVTELIQATSKQPVVDSLLHIETKFEPFTLYSGLNKKDSSVAQSEKQHTSNYYTVKKTEYTGSKIISKSPTLEKGWVLILALAALIMLIIIRVYYKKFFSVIIKSFINFQVAEKLLREKNVLVRRIFLILNINFVIVIGLYFYLLIKRVGIELSFKNDFSLYLFIVFVFVVVMIFRYLLVWLIAFVFDSTPVFKEYLHNIYLINKNLGLFVLPIVVSIFYIQKPFIGILFYMATGMLLISILYRYFRAIQIIMKHNIFLFYSILYLCTFEILPILIGIKFVLMLR